MNSAPDSYSGKFCKGEERVQCFVVSCRDASKGFLGPTDEALDLVALATKVAVEGDRDLPVIAALHPANSGWKDPMDKPLLRIPRYHSATFFSPNRSSRPK